MERFHSELIKGGERMVNEQLEKILEQNKNKILEIFNGRCRGVDLNNIENLQNQLRVYKLTLEGEEYYTPFEIIDRIKEKEEKDYLIIKFQHKQENFLNKYTLLDDELNKYKSEVVGVPYQEKSFYLKKIPIEIVSGIVNELYFSFGSGFVFLEEGDEKSLIESGQKIEEYINEARKINDGTIIHITYKTSTMTGPTSVKALVKSNPPHPFNYLDLLFFDENGVLEKIDEQRGYRKISFQDIIDIKIISRYYEDYKLLKDIGSAFLQVGFIKNKKTSE
ncbi:MAG: hypothetical protein KatS3mg095_0833 [Candidatus Parcubacteria bacterium]|nr:MAG: hypothetical protein KatS3mg095_0833 [Candidatus Parcubacteria bacterium]